MITKKSKYGEVLKISGSEKVLSKYNVPCVTCPMAKMEMNTLTLEQIGGWYGIDVDSIINELNKPIGKRVPVYKKKIAEKAKTREKAKVIKKKKK
ncbi:MAG: hypothetical protein WCF78_02550 [archaeon]